MCECSCVHYSFHPFLADKESIRLNEDMIDPHFKHIAGFIGSVLLAVHAGVPHPSLGKFCFSSSRFRLRRTVEGRRGWQDGLGERACVVLEGDGSLFLNSSGYQAFPGQIGQHAHIQIAKPDH